MEWTPSPLVERFSERLVKGACGLPIADVACGSGRNALRLCELGCTVLAVDIDISGIERLRDQLGEQDQPTIRDRLKPVMVDLCKDPWPIANHSVGAIINIHFFHRALLQKFADAIIPGGLLLFQTPPGCGGNYLELPKSGVVGAELADYFDFYLYKERRVGPQGSESVTVQLLGQRR